MNKKLIAVAVAGAIAGPTIMSAAGADVSVYGALYPRVTVKDGDVSFSDGASRIGFKSSTDMGNGNTVSGVAEFGFDAGDGHWNPGHETVTDGKVVTPSTNRLANISYSGDWGSATIGSAWSISSSKHTCINSGQSCGMVGYQGRVADAIQVTGDLGGFSISAQVEADGTDSHSAWAIGTNLGLGAIDIGVFYRDAATQTTQVGATTTLAGVKLSAGFGESSDDTDSWGLAAVISGIKIAMLEKSDDNQEVTVNYNIDMGGSTLRLILSDNEPADTLLGVQWNYSL
jgi:predicted porin